MTEAVRERHSLTDRVTERQSETERVSKTHSETERVTERERECVVTETLTLTETLTTLISYWQIILYIFIHTLDSYL